MSACGLEIKTFYILQHAVINYQTHNTTVIIFQTIVYIAAIQHEISAKRYIITLSIQNI